MLALSALRANRWGFEGRISSASAMRIRIKHSSNFTTCRNSKIKHITNAPFAHPRVRIEMPILSKSSIAIHLHGLHEMRIAQYPPHRKVSVLVEFFKRTLPEDFWRRARLVKGNCEKSAVQTRFVCLAENRATRNANTAGRAWVRINAAKMTRAKNTQVRVVVPGVVTRLVMTHGSRSRDHQMSSIDSARPAWKNGRREFLTSCPKDCASFGYNTTGLRTCSKSTAGPAYWIK